MSPFDPTTASMGIELTVLFRVAAPAPPVPKRRAGGAGSKRARRRGV